MNSFLKRKSVFAPSPAGKLLSYLVLGFWTFVVLFPIYWLVVTSVKLPFQVILDRYRGDADDGPRRPEDPTDGTEPSRAAVEAEKVT